MTVEYITRLRAVKFRVFSQTYSVLVIHNDTTCKRLFGVVNIMLRIQFPNLDVGLFFHDFGKTSRATSGHINTPVLDRIALREIKLVTDTEQILLPNLTTM